MPKLRPVNVSFLSALVEPAKLLSDLTFVPKKEKFKPAIP